MECLYGNDIKKFSKTCKFFISGTEQNDIKQGSVGDCWFICIIKHDNMYS